jgi:opine dehydrogenase
MTIAPTSTSMPVAVLGGGNGGHAMAFYLASLGCAVNWWIADRADAATISKIGAVTAVGAFSGSAPVKLVSDDVSSVLKDIELVFVVVPSSAHGAVVDKVAPHLTGRETIVLNPGRTGGVVCFRRLLNRFGRFPNLTIGETQSLIFTCRRVGAGFVDVLKFKNFGQIAFVGPRRRHVEALLTAAFPQMRIEASTLSTSLANYGAMLHPAPVLFNIGRIEDPAVPFARFYDGITPTIARFIEKMDVERIQLAEIFGIETASTLEWHRLCYGVGGGTLFEALRVNERYASLEGPQNLGHRYVHEDIPTGLVPLIALADAVAHEVPCMKALLELANLVLDLDVSRPGRDAESMGIEEGFSIEQIKQLFRGAGQA